jgi:predicted metalloprotease
MGGRLPLPSGKGGIILLIVVLVAGYYGVDLTGLMTGSRCNSSTFSALHQPE